MKRKEAISLFLLFELIKINFIIKCNAKEVIWQKKKKKIIITWIKYENQSSLICVCERERERQ